MLKTRLYRKFAVFMIAVLAFSLFAPVDIARADVDTRLAFSFENPEDPVVMEPLRAETCEKFEVYGVGFKICVKTEVKNKKVNVCAKVGDMGYKCMAVVQDGCLNLNPTKIILNFKGCVRDYKATSTNVSFTFKVKACASFPGIGEKCKTFWQPKFSVGL